MSAYFIAATGTGIGKTFATCALVHAARMAGREVRAYKPVISGYDETDCDSTAIHRALGAGSTGLAEISPWRFAAPLSPDMAAKREGRSLGVAELLAWTQQTTKAPGGLCLIETVGGLMVPLNAQETTRDWMQQAGLPLVLVTGSYLGAISHTLSTLEAARTANLTIAALLVNESAGSSVELQETRDSIASHARDIPLILAQPRVSSPVAATVIHALAEQLV